MPPLPRPSYKRPIWQIYTAMVVSFIIASLLSVYPLSAQIALFRPTWLVIALVFWLIFQPTMVGVGTAFAIGLVADFLTDSRLGQQALCAVIVAFLVKFISGYVKQLSSSAVWLLAAGCFLVHQVCLIILYLFTQAVFAPQLLYSVVISVLVWPLWVAAFGRYTR